MLVQVLATRSDVAPIGIYLRCFVRIDMVCQSQAGDFVCVDRSTGNRIESPGIRGLDMQNGRQREREREREREKKNNLTE